MKKTFKEIKTTCDVLGLYSLILTMFVLTSIAFFVNFKFGGNLGGGTILSIIQLMISLLPALILVTTFSAYYQFLMPAPYKIGNVAKQIFYIFEVITTIDFAFSISVSAISGNKIMTLFQVIDYFYILILGYIIINSMANSELKMNIKNRFVWVFLINYVGVLLMYGFQNGYAGKHSDVGAFNVYTLSFVGVLLVTALVLRITLRESTSKKIRAMKKIKLKNLKAS